MDKFSKAKQLAIFIEFLDEHDAFSKYVEEMRQSASNQRFFSLYTNWECEIWISGAFLFSKSIYGSAFWRELSLEWLDYCKQFD